jgi:hypothetical protein
MCGGDLIIEQGKSFAECEYCRTKQTVPNTDNEKKISLFARANHLRANNEFDKAAGVYESIVVDFPTEAEAYWGLVLCKYGIEYVDDYATSKKIPTCHRSSFESVMDDSNYEFTIKYADGMSIELYREEARQIEEIRKKIIDVSSKEDPYDIFICYKETDEKGDRTIDSILAQDIYEALTENGYNTFFARVSLEDKLGQEYEPYIFAALNSAKIMIVIGTKSEYYNAVWVKNEWSRFLKLMEIDSKKRLFPIYKGLDINNIPKEFQRLQSLDYGKLGADRDLLHAVEKYIPPVRNQTNSLADTAKNVSDDSLQDQVIRLIAEGKKLDAINLVRTKLDCSLLEAKKIVEGTQNPVTVRREDDYNSSVMSSSPRKEHDYQTDNASTNVETVRNLIAPLQRFTFSEVNGEELILMENGTVLKHFFACFCFEQKKRTLTVKERDNEIFSLKNNRVVRKGDSVIKHSAYYGSKREVVLHSDGTMRASNFDSIVIESQISNLTNVVDFINDYSRVIVLKKDGSLVSINLRDYNGKLAEGNDYVAITDKMGLWGLHKNGKVSYLCTIGALPECAVNIEKWSNIVAISSSSTHMVGLKSDGTVVAQSLFCGETFDVSQWKGIVSVYAGSGFIAGVNVYGEVLITPTWGYLYDVNKPVKIDYRNPVFKIPGYEETYKIPNLHLFSSKAEQFKKHYKNLKPMGSQDECFDYNYETAAVGKVFDITPKKALQIICDREKQFCQSGVCRYCGGQFKGIFKKKCSKCGKEKDY